MTDSLQCVFLASCSRTTTRPQTLPTGGYYPSGAPSSFPKTVWGWRLAVPNAGWRWSATIVTLGYKCCDVVLAFGRAPEPTSYGTDG